MGISLLDEEEEILSQDEAIDTDVAFDLLCRLFRKENGEKGGSDRDRKIRSILEDCIPEEDRMISFNRDIELFGELRDLCGRVTMREHLELIASNKVIGLCGCFSAGKSGFVNSILGVDYLPEDTISTTAIPTYIAHGSEERIIAYLHNGDTCELSRELLRTMSHAFEEKYHVAFSSVIDSIVLRTPCMPYNELMLLDTPGYSAAQAERRKSESDRTKALGALEEADGILCLTSVDRGDLTVEDLHFLRELTRKEDPLFVITKRDLKSDEETRMVCEKIRLTADREGLNPYAVTAYSIVLDEHEIDGQRFCTDYMEHINGLPEEDMPLREQIKTVLEEIRKMANDRISELDREQRTQKKALQLYPNPIYAGGIVTYISKLEQEINDLKTYSKHIKSNLGRLERVFEVKE